MRRRSPPRGRTSRSTASQALEEFVAPVHVHGIETLKAKSIRLDEHTAFENRLICSGQKRNVIGAYKMLRTQVAHRMNAESWSSIAITACRPFEGKSVTAINLALSLANQASRDVFLVDMDLRNPSVSNYLGISEELKLLEIISGEVPFEEGILQVESSRLFIAANDQSVESSSELLAGSEVFAFVKTLRERGGIVIYDMPPILSSDDYLAFSGYADCTLFVVSEGQTSREDLERAQPLINPDIGFLGVVFNKSKDKGLTEDVYYYG